LLLAFTADAVCGPNQLQECRFLPSCLNLRNNIGGRAAALLKLTFAIGEGGVALGLSSNGRAKIFPEEEGLALKFTATAGTGLVIRVIARWR
jgi:hypothetical protein